MRTAQEVDRLIARKQQIEEQLFRGESDQQEALQKELDEITAALAEEEGSTTGQAQGDSSGDQEHAVSAMGTSDQTTSNAARTTDGASTLGNTPANELAGDELRQQQAEQRDRQNANEQAQAARQPDPATQVRDSVTGAPMKQDERT